MNLEPISQKKLHGLDIYFNEFKNLYLSNKLPNKILLSGLKGLGKCTLAYHFINFVLSYEDDYAYDILNYEINENNKFYKLTLNKSNPNLSLIDLNIDKKNIDINQVRVLISNLNKSSFNNKPRFVLIDNIEFLSISAINALLKTLEEPSDNIFFILINNNKKVLPTLTSRCLNFKINIQNSDSLKTANILLDNKIDHFINNDLINYYSTPGNIYNLARFAKENKYDLSNKNLKELLTILIDKKHYKKNDYIKFMIFDFIEYYYKKIDSNFSSSFFKKYSYYIKRISDTKRFNLDEESLFIEFENEILNG